MSGKFDLLRRVATARVAANGAVVQADVLQGRSVALVTLRDTDRPHSYLLLYAGDVDSSGDMGNVLDCHKWIALRSPLLIETAGYPNCTKEKYVPIKSRGFSQEFIDVNGGLISISLSP